MKPKEEFMVRIGDAEPFDFNTLTEHDRRMLRKKAPKVYAKIMHALRTGEGVIQVKNRKEET